MRTVTLDDELATLIEGVDAGGCVVDPWLAKQATVSRGRSVAEYTVLV